MSKQAKYISQFNETKIQPVTTKSGESEHPLPGIHGGFQGMQGNMLNIPHGHNMYYDMSKYSSNQSRKHKKRKSKSKSKSRSRSKSKSRSRPSHGHSTHRSRQKHHERSRRKKSKSRSHSRSHSKRRSRSPKSKPLGYNNQNMYFKGSKSINSDKQFMQGFSNKSFNSSSTHIN